ncbi:hypothetical protein U9M48_016213 [Paspalum notatum var. saurae]|uniref:Uncharacterized protein n=1 Tax=Paspalum notatum var. saurae TaxID=547442 RepID=A0AAQ3WMU6_PASNO
MRHACSSFRSGSEGQPAGTMSSTRAAGRAESEQPDSTAPAGRVSLVVGGVSAPIRLQRGHTHCPTGNGGRVIVFDDEHTAATSHLSCTALVSASQAWCPLPSWQGLHLQLVQHVEEHEKKVVTSIK